MYPLLPNSLNNLDSLQQIQRCNYWKRNHKNTNSNLLYREHFIMYPSKFLVFDICIEIDIYPLRLKHSIPISHFNTFKLLIIRKEMTIVSLINNSCRINFSIHQIKWNKKKSWNKKDQVENTKNNSCNVLANLFIQL